MFQRGECPAIQEVAFHILKWLFDLAFGLRTMRSTSPGLETIMGRECQKAGVINGLVAVVTGDHNFHVVVQTGGGQSLEVGESADVFADRGGEILRLHKAQILAARITQDVTECIHPPPPFCRKWDVVWRIIHLRLYSRSRLEALHRRLRCVWPHRAQMFLHDAVAALET